MSTASINGWFKQAMPFPSKRNRNVQFGVHIEEVAEQFDAVNLVSIATAMHQLATSFKEGDSELNLSPTDRVALLDALCDQIVTAIGVAYTHGMDIVGALEEVDRSNYSKFVDGQPVWDANGKITKGPHYFKPNLLPFV